jgi:hypothetical protein
VAGQIFQRRLVAPARRQVEVSYTAADLFTPGPSLTDLATLSWMTRLRNVPARAAGGGQADLTIAAGRADTRQFDGPNSLRFTERPASWLPPSEQPLRPSPFDSPAPAAAALDRWQFRGIGYSEEVAGGRTAGYAGADLQRLALEPIGTDRSGQVAFGYRDPDLARVQLGQATSLQAARVALDLLGQTGSAPLSHRALDANRLVSDTGELCLDAGKGRLLIQSLRCQVMAGEFAPGPQERLSHMTMSTTTGSGVLLWLSLDDRPLPETHRHLLKMVSLARNSGERLGPGAGRFAGRFALLIPGAGPVLTDGAGASVPTAVSLDGREVVRAYVRNGTWELLTEPEQRVLFCDTPGVEFWVAGIHAARALTPLQPAPPDSPSRFASSVIPVLDGRFRYPEGARVVLLQ